MSSSYILDRANKDLNDPNSPFYLGQPSSMEFIKRGMACGGGYNTHYFGANKHTFLAQPQVDTIQLLKNAKEKNIRNNWLKAITGTAIALTSLLIFRKIPGLNLIPKTVGFLFSSLGTFLKK